MNHQDVNELGLIPDDTDELGLVPDDGTDLGLVPDAPPANDPSKLVTLDAQGNEIQKDAPKDMSLLEKIKYGSLFGGQPIDPAVKQQRLKETVGDYISGVPRGITQGISDKTAAIGDTLLDEGKELVGLEPEVSMKNRLKANLKAYEAIKNAERERSPIASPLGELTGAVATPMPVGNLKNAKTLVDAGKNVLKAGALGAAYGGISAAGNAPIVTDNNEYRFPLEEILAGAKTGAAVNGGLQTAMEIPGQASRLVPDSLKELFEGSKNLTSQGEKFIGDAAKGKYQDKAAAQGEKIIGDFTDDLKNTIGDRTRIIDDMEKNGALVDVAKERDGLEKKIRLTSDTILPVDAKDKILKEISQKHKDSYMLDTVTTVSSQVKPGKMIPGKPGGMQQLQDSMMEKEALLKSQGLAPVAHIDTIKVGNSEQLVGYFTVTKEVPNAEKMIKIPQEKIQVPSGVTKDGSPKFKSVTPPPIEQMEQVKNPYETQRIEGGIYPNVPETFDMSTMPTIDKVETVNSNPVLKERGTQLSPRELEEIRNYTKDLSGNLGIDLNKESDGYSKAFKNIQTPDGDNPLAPITEKLSRGYDFQDLMGLPKEMAYAGDQEKLAAAKTMYQKIVSGARTSDGSAFDKESMKRAAESLKTLNPELGQKLEEYINRNQMLDRLNKATGLKNVELSKPASWFKGPVEAGAAYSGYVAGKVEGVAGKAVNKVGDLNFIRRSAEKLIQSPDATSQKLGRIFERMTNKDSVGRQAMMFGAMQMPEYRQILESNPELIEEVPDESGQ